MKPEQTTRLQGTLHMLILKIAAGRRTSWIGRVSQNPAAHSRHFFRQAPLALSPLHRMEEEGWISGFWGDSENHCRAKYYRLTKAGRKQLDMETQRWDQISWAIAKALEAS